MPSTYTCLHYHLIFSVKNREPRLAAGWRSQLYEYLGGTVRGLGGTPQSIGGVADHVHLLTGLKASHCLADFVREIKKASSLWIRQGADGREFYWQEGYAAFSVSFSALEAVREYIGNQEEHHRNKSFREELVAILKKSKVDFDERFLD